jgi:hypothetical protein
VGQFFLECGQRAADFPWRYTVFPQLLQGFERDQVGK